MKTPSSEWITETAYRRVDMDGRKVGFLVLFLDKATAMLYSEIPSHLHGLLLAGLGGKSIGSAYNKLVKSRYPYQRIEGAEKVRELRELMLSA